MKKIHAGIIAAALLATGVLAGCGNSEESTDTTASPSPAAAGAATDTGTKAGAPSLSNAPAASAE